VARAGYIECPDAFFERINPYKDHRYEITERGGKLVTRRKLSWIRDTELVELYERQLKPSSGWRDHLRKNPFAFHVRYFWSRGAGGISHLDLTPDSEQTVPFREEPAERSTVAEAPHLPRLSGMARRLLAQSARNRELDLLQVLRCVACHASNLESQGHELLCRNCGRRYPESPVLRMFAEPRS
jgi:uncharacterized protein YbaR (Trm112 family)